MCKPIKLTSLGNNTKCKHLSEFGVKRIDANKLKELIDKNENLSFSCIKNNHEIMKNVILNYAQLDDREKEFIDNNFPVVCAETCTYKNEIDR